MRDNERCGRSKKARTPELIGQIKNFMHKDRRVSIETISAQFDVIVGTVHKIIHEDFHWAFQKLLKRCNKCIAAGGDYFEGDSSFMCLVSIKVPIRKKSGNLLKTRRIYIYIYIY